MEYEKVKSLISDTFETCKNEWSDIITEDFDNILKDLLYHIKNEYDFEKLMEASKNV